MDNESRMKWYLKNLLFCKEYGGVCITHQNLIDNFGEYQKRVGERFLSEFEIRYFNEQEFSSIKQYAIEDSVFSQIEKQCGSRSAEISHLLGEDDFLLHKSLDRIFHKMKDDFPNENIEMAFILGLKQSIIFNAQKNKIIHPNTLSAWNYMLMNGKQKEGH